MQQDLAAACASDAEASWIETLNTRTFGLANFISG